jgi:hypothetical protein
MQSRGSHHLVSGRISCLNPDESSVAAAYLFVYRLGEV